MSKRRKKELLWLIGVVLFYVLYNLPMVPKYGDAKGMIIHALVTLVPLWIIVYAGFFAVCKAMPIKDEDSDDSKDTSEKEEKTC